MYDFGMDVSTQPTDTTRQKLLQAAFAEIYRNGFQAASLTQILSETGLTKGAHQREADEFISVHQFRWSEIGRMIRRGEIRDGKSLATLLYVQAFAR